MEMTLTKTRIRAGIWEGVLTFTGTAAGTATGTAAEAPKLEVLHLERSLPGVQVQPIAGRDGEHSVKVPIPLDVLSEGVQTFVIRAVGSDETLAHFTIVTGVPLEDDIRAEIDLLRAELDMLKRAFRRHCLETM